jgi:hypothetical protein
MQVSTNLPSGSAAIEEHLATGEPLQMNVSKKADREFRFELKKTDRKRWANLDAGAQREFYRKQRGEPRRELPSNGPNERAA